MDILSRVQLGEAAHKNLRRHRRYGTSGDDLEVSWLDKCGNMKTTRAKVLNVSEHGIAFRVPEAGMPSLVRFKSNRFNVNGIGSVRHCYRAGFKYIVGLEFGFGLRWGAPAGEVQEPIPLCSRCIR
jgi:hypothetical protein